jgi:hypothetical protein
MSQYLIVLRDANWNPESLSPEELQAIMKKYRTWIEGIAGKGNKLRDKEGRVVRSNGGGVSVTDGPYSEAKEVIGGYIVIEADSYEDAVKKCEDSPHLVNGSIEIRALEVR